MTSGLVTGLYVVAGVLFIRSLGGLSTQETARRGNLYGMIGMVLAVVATAASAQGGQGTMASSAPCSRSASR
jgi:NAD(P) transhydrogenase subunit beta